MLTTDRFPECARGGTEYTCVSGDFPHSLKVEVGQTSVRVLRRRFSARRWLKERFGPARSEFLDGRAGRAGITEPCCWGDAPCPDDAPRAGHVGLPASPSFLLPLRRAFVDLGWILLCRLLSTTELVYV